MGRLGFSGRLKILHHSGSSQHFLFQEPDTLKEPVRGLFLQGTQMIERMESPMASVANFYFVSSFITAPHETWDDMVG